MSPLDALQGDLRRAFVGGDARAASRALRDGGIDPAARLRIHRHHYVITLTDALAATFPVVARLLGEPCFAFLAREFCRLSPPTSPCLFEYGSGFARYLTAVPTLMALPYLPDVARLEWALNESRHAADAKRLPSKALGLLMDCSFAEVTLALHPSVRLFASPYAVERVWCAHQPGADGESRIAFDGAALRLLILRDRDDDVVRCALPVGVYTFLSALRGGVPLGRAWSRASADDPAFDGSHALAGLLEAGVFTTFRFPTTRKEGLLP